MHEPEYTLQKYGGRRDGGKRRWHSAHLGSIQNIANKPRRRWGGTSGGGEAHGNITRTVYVFHLTILFPLPLFSSIWQYRFSLQIRHHRVRAPPPPTPPLHVNIYFSQLQTYALLRYTGSWGGGGGRGTTRRPGVVHILGLLGVGHISINEKKTYLRNHCLRNILLVNTSQAVPNPLNIII